MVAKDSTIVKYYYSRIKENLQKGRIRNKYYYNNNKNRRLGIWSISVRNHEPRGSYGDYDRIDSSTI